MQYSLAFTRKPKQYTIKSEYKHQNIFPLVSPCFFMFYIIYGQCFLIISFTIFHKKRFQSYYSQYEICFQSQQSTLLFLHVHFQAHNFLYHFASSEYFSMFKYNFYQIMAHKNVLYYFSYFVPLCFILHDYCI